MKKFTPLYMLALGLLLSACKPTMITSPLNGQTFPAWIRQSNIYEVNVRQYSPEGTFTEFAKSLPRLKAMGVDILWFMPIQPISKVDRKGVLGSYYAVADYQAVNPEFGTMEDWQALVKQAHSMGFKIIIDWVANHTGADNHWLTTHPDFYVRDKSGVPQIAFDWADTRDLNFDNRELRDSMTAAMAYWIKEGKVDGFRCDVAGEVPADFWKTAITKLRTLKPDLFMLAEADQGWLHEVGFNETYAWDMFATMKRVASGQAPALALDSVLAKEEANFPKGAIKLYFTSNHDENSWNKSDYGTFPGAKHAPFAVFSQTMKNSLPLIYSGQEVPVLDSISFFYKNPIAWNKYERADFYRTLLELRKKNKALAVDANFTKLSTTADDKVYAYLRERDGQKVLVLLNLSDKDVSFTLNNPQVQGRATNVFSGATVALDAAATRVLTAWGYEVYSYQ